MKTKVVVIGGKGSAVVVGEQVYDAQLKGANIEFLGYAFDDPNFGKVLHPGVIPKMSGEDPGGVAWPGPDVGAHTNSVLQEILKMKIDEIEALRVEGVL